jgi:hypothetical protein
MEDNRKVPERSLLRCFERSRLEEHLWTMAYEQIWPVVRKSLKRRTDAQQRRQGAKTTNTIARRA